MSRTFFVVKTKFNTLEFATKLKDFLEFEFPKMEIEIEEVAMPEISDEDVSAKEV